MFKIVTPAGFQSTRPRTRRWGNEIVSLWRNVLVARSGIPFPVTSTQGMASNSRSSVNLKWNKKAVCGQGQTFERWHPFQWRWHTEPCSQIAFAQSRWRPLEWEFRPVHIERSPEIHSLLKVWEVSFGPAMHDCDFVWSRSVRRLPPWANNRYSMQSEEHPACSTHHESPLPHLSQNWRWEDPTTTKSLNLSLKKESLTL